jgi:hypothetical protein
VSADDRRNVLAAFGAALSKYVDAAPDAIYMIPLINAIFEIADKTKSHRILLESIYLQLRRRHGDERVGRLFLKMSKPAYAAAVREFFLISEYYSSGKTQDEFAEWAANQNKTLPPIQHWGTGSASPAAIKKCLTRAIGKRRKEIKAFKEAAKAMPLLQDMLGKSR